MIIAGTAFSQATPPAFDAQIIDDRITIGYGVAIGDVDGDGKPDILLADKKEFVWYRNGDWKRFVMAENLTEHDNVCIAARDIDGDGKVEVAVGAQWNPGETSDTTKSGSVHYLISPKDPTAKWQPVKLHHEPTVHRMRWVKISKRKFMLIVAPLHGRGNKNGEGEGVKVLAYDVPEDPKGEWKYSVIDQSMHLTHNFAIEEGDPERIVIGGKEGLKSCSFANGSWGCRHFFKEKAFGEITVAERIGHVGVSPMHGNQLIWPLTENCSLPRDKNVIVLSSDLNQGHAIGNADFIPGGTSEIIVGWREPNKENKVGIKIFVCLQETTTPVWKEFWVDENGMACEDLQVGDLDGDGKKDIVAAGRSTHNLKIYWNRN